MLFSLYFLLWGAFSPCKFSLAKIVFTQWHDPVILNGTQ